MPRPFVDVTGQRFASLVVKELIDKTFCTAVCDCGNETRVRINNVKKGHTRSCGCLGKSNALKHGIAKEHPEIYLKWTNMMGRCYRASSKHYDNYGGRGIGVCARWHDVKAFSDDMQPSYVVGLTLERRDSNGDYSLSNCYWATRQEQQNNRRVNRRIETPHGTMTVAQAARAYGLTHKVLTYRLNAGWNVARALSTPLGAPPGRKRKVLDG